MNLNLNLNVKIKKKMNGSNPGKDWVLNGIVQSSFQSWRFGSKLIETRFD